jgi:hypothetical protein
VRELMCDGQKGEEGKSREGRDKARGKASKNRKIKKSFSKQIHFGFEPSSSRAAF